ncbi:fimbria/pilus outer membrane usher protein [Xylophilus rhododendri]|uniref:Fimbria/pilus outer membrane usher protein n=1 Tax=Xylophilus rhododendri TaxID=2697032 RepID=A0A857J6T6_9BURK|nr:fimbria/pilus outer membrane usher protein [Xylophilus rhododendri]QHI98722.1 fimbria/pilus outer membrane usher protein [Xylophilus rhododendri]
MRRRPGTLLLAAACLALAGPPAGAQPGPPPPAVGDESWTFDTQLLGERGLPPSLARYFAAGGRFAAGWQAVQLSINGESRGVHRLLFDAGGQPCFLPAFLAEAGLLAAGDGAAAPDACPDPRRVLPRALVSLRPQAGAVEIGVPQELLRPVAPQSRSISGGLGALFNYRAYALDFGAGGDAPRLRNRYVDTTAGLNAGGWLLRSQQDWDGSSGSASRLRWRGAYAQTTLEARQQVLQAGLLSLQDPLFGGLPLLGVQGFPERTLIAGNSYAVTGLANALTRVRLLQHGVPLLDTVVPPGPYALSNYVLTDRNSELEVQLQEEGGASQAYVVPSATLLLAAGNAQFEGWNLAAGTLRDPGGERLAAGPALASGSRGWTHGPLAGVAGLLASAGYAAAGTAVNARLESLQSQLWGQLLVSQHGGQQGLLGSTTASRAVGGAWSLGVSASLRSPGYRSVQDTEDVAQRSQLGLALGWHAGAAGAVSLGLARVNQAGSGAADTVNLAWSKSFAAGASLNVGLARRDTHTPSAVSGAASSNSLFVNLSWPLGGNATSRSTLQQQDGLARRGISVEQRVHPQFGWRASMDEGSGPSGRDLTVYGTPWFSTLSAGISQSGPSQSLHGEASGGVVLTGDGLAFSPYPVQDSFGTVRTGDVALVRIDTPQGPVWSGPHGLAALPALPAYLDSRIELAGKSVPLDVEVQDGLQVVQAGRGAVLRLNMGLQRVHRWMLAIRLADGSRLPAGSAILRNGSELVTVSDDDGRALVIQRDEQDRWSAELADGQRCAIGLFEPEPARPDDFFIRASARCL